MLHCIRDCPRVKRIWEKLGFGDISFFQQTNVQTWLKLGATGKNDKLFIATIWWSWKARNAKCFNNEDIPSHRLLLAILNLYAIFKACFDKNEGDSTAVRQISWLNKDQEGIILNVDGSSLGNPGPGGFGGLARNPDGGWLFGFSGHIGLFDVLKAELLGILNGLKIAWDRGFRDIICYTDSMNAMQLIKEQQADFHRYATIVQEIKDLLILPWKVAMHHTLREGNQSADLLAKWGASISDQLKIFEVPPPEMGLVLAGDVAGVAFPRGFPHLNPPP